MRALALLLALAACAPPDAPAAFAGETPEVSADALAALRTQRVALVGDSAAGQPAVDPAASGWSLGASAQVAGERVVHVPPAAHGTPARASLAAGTPGAAPSRRLPRGQALWDLLATTPTDPSGMQRTAPFPPDVAALDGTHVSVTGFLLPTDTAARPRHFLLSVYPLADCFFCFPGGAASLVEVRARRGVAATADPVTLRGTFRVLASDPTGLLFRLDDATPQP